MDRVGLLAWARAQSWMFRSYYKYGFTFSASADGFEAIASVGGQADSIYRFEVQDPMTWDEICYAGEPYLRVTDADGKLVCEG